MHKTLDIKTSSSVHRRTTVLQLAVCWQYRSSGGGGGSKGELQQLTERLEKKVAGYGLEISSDKSKILVNSIKPRLSTNIWINGKTLEAMDQFKYLGSAQTKGINKGTKDHTGAVALAHSAMTRSTTIEKQSHQFSYKG